MFSTCKIGKETLGKNSFGESTKTIQWSSVSYFCEEKSVKFTEFYQAMASGYKADKLVVMNKYDYYEFVKDSINRIFLEVYNQVIDKDIQYTIIRTFEKDDDRIELTLARGIENVSS